MTKELDWSRWLGPEAAPTLAEQMALVLRLSVPAILAEVSSTAMNYIDSAMVGSLGANATAAIGLVASTTWLFGGLCIAMVTGFSVQIAHLIGGGRRAEAQSVVRQGLMAALLSRHPKLLHLRCGIRLLHLFPVLNLLDGRAWVPAYQPLRGKPAKEAGIAPADPIQCPVA